MELKVWSKTLLNVYGCLHKLAKAIDKLVIGFGLNSGKFYGVENTFNNAQKMIELTDRKITLINLKVLIDNIMNDMDKTSCKILILKFFDKVSNETIINALGLKRRTYFRKYNSALSSFANLLLIKGFNKDTAYNFINNETWIISVYEEILKRELSKQNEGDVSKISIFSRAVKDYKIVRNNSLFF